MIPKSTKIFNKIIQILFLINAWITLVVSILGLIFSIDIGFSGGDEITSATGSSVHH